MRAAAALSLLVLAGCGAGAGPPAPLERFGPDRIRYELDLVHREHRLDGTQRISFRNPFREPLRHVWIRAWDNAYGSCAEPAVRVTGPVVERRRGCTALKLRLAEPVAPGRRGEVRLRIAIRVPPRFDRFGRLGDTDVLGNAIPVLAVSDRGAEPALPPYSFRGEAFFSLAADWDVRLRVRPREVVASTGRRIGRERWIARRERDFALVIGPMRVTERRVGATRVRWFGPSHREGLRLTALALRALERDLGPYGAPELDVVETPPRIARGGLAMEYPQLILSPAIAQAVAHEVAHQWFFRLVGNDQWSDPWVDETLTSFAAIRLGRGVHGPDRLAGCARRTRPARLPRPADADMRTLGAHSRETLYVEGPCALFNLQRRIGERRATAFLRGLVDDHRHGVLTGSGLSRAIGRLPTGDRALRELRVRPTAR